MECPFCGKQVDNLYAFEVYTQSFGIEWLCKNCYEVEHGECIEDREVGSEHDMEAVNG